jgi:hypothetical protein
VSTLDKLLFVCMIQQKNFKKIEHAGKNSVCKEHFIVISCYFAKTGVMEAVSEATVRESLLYFSIC